MLDMKKFSLARHDPQLQDLIARTDHKNLAQWAIECLNRSLSVFEERYPDERLPREAIKILQDWMEDRITMWEARKHCWDILALARKIESEDKACAQIVRAASHCLATCHVPTHAEGTVMYVISAIKHLNHDKENVIALMEKERAWQISRLEELANRN